MQTNLFQQMFFPRIVLEAVQETALAIPHTMLVCADLGHPDVARPDVAHPDVAHSDLIHQNPLDEVAQWNATDHLLLEEIQLYEDQFLYLDINRYPIVADLEPSFPEIHLREQELLWRCPR